MEASDRTSEPRLAEPRLLPARTLAGGGALLAAGVVVAVMTIMQPHEAPRPPEAAPAAPSRRDEPAMLSVTAGSTVGAFVVLQQPFQDNPGSVLAQMNLDEPDKARLRANLSDGSARLSLIRLWDTQDEDGDQVEVLSAGFRQRLTILNKPHIFFVPIQPGGTVRIKGVHDGGGGITLGVATALGPVPLPRLSIGQILELPAQ